MADLKLVGTVAIKVRPDATGFRREAQKQIKKELAGLDAKIEVKAELSEPAKVKIKADAKKLKKELEEAPTITWNVKLDRDSVLAAQKKLDDILKPREPISFSVDDDASIAAAKTRLEELARDAKVEITYHDDARGFQTVLDKIAEVRRGVEIPVSFDVDDESLDEKELEFRNKLAKIPVGFTYDRDATGLQKVIAEIDAELAKHLEVTVETTLDPLNLAFTKARLEAELEKQTIRIEYDESLASLRAAKARIEALLHIPPLGIETKLDEASLTAALAKINGLIAAANATNQPIRPQVQPQISGPSYVRTAAALRALGRNQIVQFFVRLDNSSVLLAAAKLTGLRAASRWTEELARSLGRLDRNLPIVAAVVLTLSTLASGLLTLTASAFSLGNGLGEVVRMAGLLSPALLSGFAAVMTVFTGVFKDFGAAVNGDEKAIAKLTESGKKAAAEIRVHFQSIRETISANFWKSAGDAMLNFVRTALPALQNGFGTLSTSLGGVFSRILDAVSLFTQQDGIGVFFSNLTRGFDVAQTGMASFMSGFLTLATVGSTVFPQLGRAFEEWATRFDAWVQRLAADGTLNRWIDQGIQGLKDLLSAGGSLVGVWANIGQAAQAAGALTLHSFAQMSQALEDATAGSRFQRNMTNIFKGAREASDEFHRALGDLGPAMDVFSVTIKDTLSGAGAALGAFIDAVGDVFSSPRLNTGMTAFLSGLKDMFESLRPAAAPVAEILQTFGEVLGAVARDSGPLFRTLFAQLATVLTTAWHALEPFLPALVDIGTTIVSILGPAMASLAESVIPAFAEGVQKIGEFLEPLVAIMSFFTTEAVKFIAAMPPGVVIGIATGIFAMAGAIKFAATVMPIARIAIEALGIASGVAASRMALLIPGIGIFLAAATAVAAGGVATLADSQDAAVGSASAYADAIREDADATEEFGKKTEEAVKKVAIKDLTDSGAFDLGAKLRLSIGTVTQAALGNKKAQDEVSAAIANANKVYDDNLKKSTEANKGATTYSGTVKSSLTPSMLDNVEAGKGLNNILGQIQGKYKQGTHIVEQSAEADRAAGIETRTLTKAQKELSEALDSGGPNIGRAAAATKVLTDTMSSSAAKIDAMRDSFEILVGTNAKQKAAESLGAYNKGFNDLKETVAPLAQNMRDLGEEAFGEGGFLNVAGGNKAVLQVSQALVEQVDAIWLGAKQAYDAAIQQGDNATVAFAKAKEFVDQHKGDYVALADAAGVNSDRVLGYLDQVFGKEWALKVSFNGLTETATIAQNILRIVKGQWDGESFAAFFELHPEAALLAMEDPFAAANLWVTSTWAAKFDALPEEAQDKIKGLIDMTDEEWTNASFAALVTATADQPKIQQALIDIRNGVEGVDIEALVKAIADGTSIEEARNAIDEAAKPRKAPLVVEADTDGANKKLEVTAEKRLSLTSPVPAMIVDADTDGANAKIDASRDKALALRGPWVPLVDADTSAADTKLDTTQGKADTFNNARPNPFVDADTGTADGKMSNSLGLLQDIDSSRPFPFVDADTGTASNKLSGIQAQLNGITGVHFAQVLIDYQEANRNPALAFMQDGFANGGITKNGIRQFANGGITRPVHKFASGGFENHIAQITRPGGPIRVWSEPETQGEAYLPYAMSKRPRSVAILHQVAKDFGYTLNKKSASYADGGISAPPTSSQHNTASVHIGQLITTDPEAAVRKIRISQQDALAVAGISLNGA